MDTLPSELLPYIISFLPLTSLIAARGVNTRWRYFAQGASLHSARKTLLDLYLAAIAHPNFSTLVKAMQPNVIEFDREAYIADLTSRGCVLPDLFELWILEWPSSAIYFWAWPGLAVVDDDDAYYFYGENSLGDATNPTIDTIPIPKKEAAHVGKPTCQALALCKVDFLSLAGEAYLWLVVDTNERINDKRAGRLLWTYSYYNFINEANHPDSHKIFYDTPFGPAMDFKLTHFLGLLDTDRENVNYIIEGYFWNGIRETDD